MRAAVLANAADLLAYFGRRIVLRDDAPDLLAETLEIVWRRIADLPADETRARMWMFGVAKRTLSNYHWGRGRQSDLTERLRQAYRTEQRTYEPKHERDDVWAVVDTLPAPQREIVLLVHAEGFTVTEAAVIMRSSASTARTRYSTALGTLRTGLRDALPVGEIHREARAVTTRDIGSSSAPAHSTRDSTHAANPLASAARSGSDRPPSIRRSTSSTSS